MKKLKHNAPKEPQRKRVTKEVALAAVAKALNTDGARRVLVVYDDPEHARVYQEPRA